MPAASVKVEKQPTIGEVGDVQKQLQLFVDKKIRNLEKRKNKLQVLRDGANGTKELNEDQKQAIKKYDGVIEILDFLKELNTSIASIFTENSKNQKKVLKKEQLERQQHEIERLKNAIIVQDVLASFDGEAVKNDFLQGTNGALKLTQVRLGHIDELYSRVTSSFAESKPEEYTKKVNQVAENLFALTEGKNRDMVKGATFKEMKECIFEIYNSGYFQGKNKTENVVVNEHVNELKTTGDQYVSPPRQFDQENKLHGIGQNQIPSGVSFIPDNAIENELHHKDPAVVAVASVPSYSYQYGGQTSESLGVPIVTTTNQKIAGYNNAIPSQTFTNQSYAALMPNYGVPVTLAAGMIVQQLPTQTPQTNDLGIQINQQPQTGQTYLDQTQFTTFSSDNQQNASQDQGGNYNQSDNYGQKGSYRNNGKSSIRNPRNNVNGYSNNRSGQPRNGNKGGSFGTFQSNRENGGTSYGGNERFKSKNQYSGNRGPQHYNRNFDRNDRPERQDRTERGSGNRFSGNNLTNNK